MSTVFAFILRALAVFALTTIADVCWAEYAITATGRGNRIAIKAGFWSAAIVALSGVNTLTWVHDWRLLFPAVGGSFFGTWLVVRRNGEGESGARRPQD